MGSSSSKAARSAVGAAARKYPTKPSASTISSPNDPPAAVAAGPTVHPPPRASQQDNEFVNLDAADPVYGSQLRSLGAVEPNPMQSNSSISSRNAALGPQNPPPNLFPDSRFANPAVTLLNRRQTLQEEAQREWEGVGRKSFAGRTFIDVGTIRQILTLRDHKGRSSEEIEKALGLQSGVVQKLGLRGVVESL